VEELDAEMDDYFPAADGNDAMVTNGNAAAAATGVDDTNMVDEML
jgi:THO complex subunit 4